VGEEWGNYSVVPETAPFHYTATNLLLTCAESVRVKLNKQHVFCRLTSPVTATATSPLTHIRLAAHVCLYLVPSLTTATKRKRVLLTALDLWDILQNTTTEEVFKDHFRLLSTNKTRRR
jgi:hypothetical protein